MVRRREGASIRAVRRRRRGVLWLVFLGQRELQLRVRGDCSKGPTVEVDDSVLTATEARLILLDVLLRRRAA